MVIGVNDEIQTRIFRGHDPGPCRLGDIHHRLVRVTGFEPVASRIRTACSSQAELHPENIGAPYEIPTRVLWIDNPALSAAKLTGPGGGGRSQTGLLPLARRLLSRKRPRDWLRLLDSNPHQTA